MSNLSVTIARHAPGIASIRLFCNAFFGIGSGRVRSAALGKGNGPISQDCWSSLYHYQVAINLDGSPSFHELRREQHIQMIVDVSPVRAQPLVTLGECAGLGVR